MKSAIALLSVLLAAGSSLAAPVPPRPKISQPTEPAPVVRTISQLRQIRFPYRPIKLTPSASQAGDGDAAAGGTQTTTKASDAYKTAKGVVLGPGRWDDTRTGATLVAYNVALTSYTAQQAVLASDTASVPIQVMTGASEQEYCIAGVNYFQMENGTHTYMLTLGLLVTSQDLQGSLRIRVLGQDFTGSQLIVNGSTVRVLFTTEPFEKATGGYMYANVFCKTSATLISSWYCLDFYNIQLAQLD